MLGGREQSGGVSSGPEPRRPRRPRGGRDRHARRAHRAEAARRRNRRAGADGRRRVPDRRPRRARDRPQPAARLPRHLQRRRSQLDLPSDDEHRSTLARTTSPRRCCRRRRSSSRGLAVAFAFRCGMFNIGGQGQYFVGLYVANWLGYDFAGDEPAAAHPDRGRRRRRSPGAVWAGIAGFLKATVGAHEVISTIMLNWIAIWVGEWLFGDGGPLQNAANTTVPISNDVAAERAAAGLLGRAGAPGPPHRLLRRARRARRLLGRSSTGRRSATRCARSASTPRRPRTAASA